MKNLFATLPFLLLMATTCANAPAQQAGRRSPYDTKISVGSKQLSVQVASSPADMARGLSGRNSMGEGQGMLFMFGTSTTPSFWMKDMKFDLDLVWINRSRVIAITPNVPAPNENLNLRIENLPTYSPPSPADTVLEVNAGWTEKNKIKVGDEVRTNDNN